MNSTALQIYSFFMRTNLQFVRYCHPAYTNRNQWKSLLKKSKLEATMPVCSVIPHESGYALYLHPEETPAPSGSESLTAACCTLLHCLPHTLSPLGLLFDVQNQCPLYLHPDFQSISHWWFSPCSDVSSVFLSQAAFLEQFLPQIHHPIHWKSEFNSR